MQSASFGGPLKIRAREGSLFVMELCLTCIAIVGALQSAVGIIAQSLPLAGISDYSSPIGSWIILWMAVANALCAFSVMFDLVTVTFFGDRISSPELILTTIISIAEISIAIFMLYVLRHASAAVIYLSTTTILCISILWMNAQSCLSHRPHNNLSAPPTTVSLLLESPIEISETNPSTKNEVDSSDALRELDSGYTGVACEAEDQPSLKQSKAEGVVDTTEQVKASRSPRLSFIARLAIVVIPLLLSLSVHAFLCSQAYLLLTLSSKTLTSRSVTLYSYINDTDQTGRYISSINLDIIRPPRGASSSYTCITIMLHDQGQDSTTLLPLVHSSSVADPNDCLYVLLDRPGYGSSSVGKYPLDLVTEAKIVNSVALLLAAEVAFDLRDSCQLTARYNSISEQYELLDARYIESCFSGQNISTELISQKARFTCVGHGSGTSVCLTWAKLVARAPNTLVVPVGTVVGIDYFPPHLVLEALFGTNTSAAILQQEEGKLMAVKSVVAPLSLGSFMYDTGRYVEMQDYVMHLADTVPKVHAPEMDRFRKRTSLCTFSDGYSASISETAAYNSQIINLDEFTSQGIALPNTTLFLLVLSAHGCTRGPSTVECSLFGSDEERTEILARVVETLQLELLDTLTEVYSGPPSDLWSAPQNIARWLVKLPLQSRPLNKGVGGHMCAPARRSEELFGSGTFAAHNTKLAFR